MMATLEYSSLTLDLPADWSDRTALTAQGKRREGFSPTVIVTRVPARPEETVEALARRALPRVKGGATASTVKEGPATFGSLRGYLRVQRIARKAQTLEQAVFVVLHGGIGHLVNYVDVRRASGPQPGYANIFAGLGVREASPRERKASSFGR
jgi:hypothetical protein